MEAVKRFAGLEPERAVYYPEDDKYFAPEERSINVRHYEVHAEALNIATSRWSPSTNN